MEASLRSFSDEQLSLFSLFCLLSSFAQQPTMNFARTLDTTILLSFVIFVKFVHQLSHYFLSPSLSAFSIRVCIAFLCFSSTLPVLKLKVFVFLFLLHLFEHQKIQLAFHEQDVNRILFISRPHQTAQFLQINFTITSILCFHRDVKLAKPAC